MLEFKVIEGKNAGIEDAFAVRNIVFVEEQGFGADIEVDENDAIASHVVGYGEGKPICTGRLFHEAGGRPGMLHVGRVCVLKDHRGKGYGKAVVQQLMALAKEKGAIGIELGAQLHATGFYEELGLCMFGEPFLEEGVEHIMMEKIFV